MKLRPRIFLALACLLLALSTPAGRAQTQGAITEEQALAVVAAFDRGARAAKINDIAALLAEEVQFKIALEMGEIKKDFEMNRDQFIAETRSGFAKRLAYEAKRLKAEVTISKDGQRAMITGELFEKTTHREGTMSAISSEVFILKLRGGKPVVTSYDANIRIFAVQR